MEMAGLWSREAKAHQRAEKAEEELMALRQGNKEAAQIERERNELL